MTQRILLLRQNVKWKSWDKFMKEFSDFYKKHNIDVNLVVDVKDVNFKNVEVETRKNNDGYERTAISKDWYDRNISAVYAHQYEHVAFIWDRKDFIKLTGNMRTRGIQTYPNLGILEYFVCAYEDDRIAITERGAKTLRERDDNDKYSDTKFIMSQFVYTLTHEIAHGLTDQQRKNDQLHEYIRSGKYIEYYTDYLGLKKRTETADFVDENLPIRYIAVHHTAVSREDSYAQLSAVNKYHRDKNWGSSRSPWYQKKPSSLGWYVGYNFFCDVNGKRTQTREVGEEQLAQVGHNCDIINRCDTISYCLAGDFNRELLTDAQIKDLRNFVRKMKKVYPNIKVKFHRDLQKGRTCPGSLFTREYLEKRILQENIEESPTDEEKRKEIMLRISLLQEIVKLLVKLKVLRGRF